MRAFIFTILFLIACNTNGQGINYGLKKQLDSIMYIDQTLRELYDNHVSNERVQQILDEFKIEKSDFSNTNWSILIKYDSLNQNSIKKIIKQYGYHGKSMVGEPTNKAVWYVVQHSNLINEYFPIIKKAGLEKELSMHLVATMEDRLLMNKGLEQIYGTQLYGLSITNKESGINEWIHFVWPIKDAKNVNKLRQEIGIKNTVEEFAKEFGIEYKVLTIEDVNKLKK
jgi:hypothetical protein